MVPFFGRADQNSSVLMDAITAEGTLGVGCVSQHCSPALLSPVGSPRHCHTFFFFFPRVVLGLPVTHCESFRMPPPSSYLTPLPSSPPLLHLSSEKYFLLPSQVVGKPCQLHSWYYHPLSSAKKEIFPERLSLTHLQVVLKCSW